MGDEDTESIESGPPPQPTNRVSFAELLRNQAIPPPFAPGTNVTAEKSFLAHPPITKTCSIAVVDGEEELIFSDEVTSRLAEPFKLSLVGKFTHGYPALLDLHKLFTNLRLKGTFHLRPLNLKHLLIILSNDEDFAKIWERRQWNCQGFPLRVFKWSPDFNPGIESPLAPVWIRFPGLPVHLFDRNAIFDMAERIGVPLRIDDPTALKSKLALARVCVEIDVTAPLKHSIKLNIMGKSVAQKIIYEDIPKYCSFCKHMGHLEEECFENGKVPKPVNRRQGNMKPAQGDHKKQMEKSKDIPAKNQQHWIEVKKGKKQNARGTDQADHDQTGPSGVKTDQGQERYVNSNQFQALIADGNEDNAGLETNVKHVCEKSADDLAENVLEGNADLNDVDDSDEEDTHSDNCHENFFEAIGEKSVNLEDSVMNGKSDGELEGDNASGQINPVEYEEAPTVSNDLNRHVRKFIEEVLHEQNPTSAKEDSDIDAHRDQSTSMKMKAPGDTLELIDETSRESSSEEIQPSSTSESVQDSPSDPSYDPNASSSPPDVASIDSSSSETSIKQSHETSQSDGNSSETPHPCKPPSPITITFPKTPKNPSDPPPPLNRTDVKRNALYSTANSCEATGKKSAKSKNKKTILPKSDQKRQTRSTSTNSQ